MIIDDIQFSIIREHLLNEGIKNFALQDDLIDHFSCIIEEYLNKGVSFEEALDIAKKRIAPDGVLKIEEDLNYLLTINNQIMIRKIVFLMGYISVFQIITAFALYLPGFIDKEVSGIIAMGGIFLFSTTVIPFYFYLQYKKSIDKLKEA